MSKVAKEMAVIAEVAGFQSAKSIGLSNSFLNKDNGDRLDIRFSDGYFWYTNGTTSIYGEGQGLASLSRVLIERLKGLR